MASRTPTPTIEVPLTPDQEFLAEVRSGTGSFPILGTTPDEVLIGYAQRACELVRSGLRAFDVTDQLNDETGFPFGAMTYVVMAAISVYCPDE